MALTLDGDNGISGINGSAATPAVQGTDTNTGLTFGTDTVNVVTGGSTRATVDSSGNVGIGTTTPASDALLTLQGTNRNIFFQADGAPTDCAIDCAGGRFVFRGGASGTTVASISEQMRLEENGRLLINTTDATGTQLLKVNGSTSGTNFGGTMSLTCGQTAPANGATLGAFNFGTETRPDGGAQIVGFADGAWTDGSDHNSGLYFATTANGATSTTERMRITSGGNIFAGGNTDQNWATNGFSVITNEGFAFTKSTNSVFGGICVLKRASAVGDGNLIEFNNASGQQGTVSLSGSTVSYNGAHLSRWSQLSGNAERTEILRGSVLSNLDEMCEWAYDAEPEVLWAEGDELPEGVSVGDVKTPAKAAGTEDNEQLNRMKVSDVEGDPNVAGVFQCWDDDDATYTNDFYCAMTGDFVIRIAQGVTVERGDLLMSAGDGTAKPQDDDIIRSKTIAKVTSTNVSCTYDDGSFCVPCVLMAC